MAGCKNSRLLKNSDLTVGGDFRKTKPRKKTKPLKGKRNPWAPISKGLARQGKIRMLAERCMKLSCADGFLVKKKYVFQPTGE